jgi:hypothetical protein
MRLQPGDAIVVPPIGAIVSIDGEIRLPAIYEINSERTVAELVSLAGGLTASANRTAIKLERNVTNRGATVEDVDLSTQAGSGEPLRDGDVIRVPPNLELLENSVRLEGNVFQPGLYPWAPGMRLTDLLSWPELVKPMPVLSYVLIRREVAPNVDIEVLSADLDGIWRRRVRMTSRSSRATPCTCSTSRSGAGVSWNRSSRSSRHRRGRISHCPWRASAGRCGRREDTRLSPACESAIYCVQAAV